MEYVHVFQDMCFKTTDVSLKSLRRNAGKMNTLLLDNAYVYLDVSETTYRYVYLCQDVEQMNSFKIISAFASLGLKETTQINACPKRSATMTKI